MTYESVENRVRQNCRKWEIAVYTKVLKTKIQVRQKCRKSDLHVEKDFAVEKIMIMKM
jgi:hypothetical protein